MSVVGRIKQKAKVGVMIVGHREYWPQFPLMRRGTIESGECFERMLEDRGEVEVIRWVGPDGTQLIDSPEKAFEAGLYFKKNDIDLCFLYLPQYVASGRWMLGALQVCCPIVLIGHAVNYELGSMPLNKQLDKGGACCVTEAYNALQRCGIEPMDFIFGRKSDEWYDHPFEKEVIEWCRAADALRAYKGAVFGYMGHTYEGMLDMNFDPTAITRSFGVYVKMLEMCELVEYVKGASDAEIAAKIEEMHDKFDFLEPSYDSTTSPISEEDVRWAAQCAVGLDKMIANNGLSAMAYYYEGLDNYYERVASNLIVGNSLLVSKGIPLAGEADMKTCMAMYTTAAIGAGGSFAEYGTDLTDNIMLVGHDGPHDIRISDKRPTIRGLNVYHGKRGHGISVEFSLRTGPITMLGLTSDINGKYRFVGAQADSQRGPVPQMGNTWTRAYIPGSNVRDFVVNWAKAGNTHHLSLCLGDQIGVIEKLAKTLPDVSFTKVV